MENRILFCDSRTNDIRLVDEGITEMIMKCKIKMLHFAWDSEKDSDVVVAKLKEFKKQTNINMRKARVYVLANFNTSHDFDLERIYTLRDMGFDPYVMIYEKGNEPKETCQMQRWVNNKYIFWSCERFEDYLKWIGVVK